MRPGLDLRLNKPSDQKPSDQPEESFAVKIFSSIFLLCSLSIFQVCADSSEQTPLNRLLNFPQGDYRIYVSSMQSSLAWLMGQSSSGPVLETSIVQERWPQILERLDELTRQFSNPLRPLVKKVLLRYCLSERLRLSTDPIYTAENIGDSFGFQFKTVGQLSLGFNPSQTIDLHAQRLGTLVTNGSYRIRAIGYAILTMATS